MTENKVEARGCAFNLGLINEVHVNLSAVNERAANFQESRSLKNEYELSWLLKALTCIDLTTLGGDDTYSNVSRLCLKAHRPLSADIAKLLGCDYNETNCCLHTAAVCVYPAKVEIASKTLKSINAKKINIASVLVATGFPCGQTPLKTRLEEIKFAVEKGANEIDVVINRNLVLTGQWENLYKEIQAMREACGENAHMKTILATGELGNLDNIYKASLVAMMAGSDFIKTSTGKETLNATIPFGIVMCRAIRKYYKYTQQKVGLKPAGGIRTAKDALSWLILVREELGKEWCNPSLFRIGASALLSDIEKEIYHFVTGEYAAMYEFEMP